MCQLTKKIVHLCFGKSFLCMRICCPLCANPPWVDWIFFGWWHPGWGYDILGLGGLWGAYRANKGSPSVPKRLFFTTAVRDAGFAGSRWFFYLVKHEVESSVSSSSFLVTPKLRIWHIGAFMAGGLTGKINHTRLLHVWLAGDDFFSWLLWQMLTTVTPFDHFIIFWLCHFLTSSNFSKNLNKFWRSDLLPLINFFLNLFFKKNFLLQKSEKNLKI